MPPKNPKISPLKVAVLANPQLAHGRNFFRGVTRYLQEQTPDIQVDFLTGEPTIQLSTLRQYDGLVVALNEALVDKLDSNVPIIRIDKTIGDSTEVEFPLDHEEIGYHAGDALDACGIISAGYYDGIRGSDTQNNRRSALRLSSFRSRISELGHPNCQREISVHQPTDYHQLRDWLLSLPKPTGIFAFNDHGALEVAEACRLEGLSIPNDVAIIGVDNDRLFCKLSPPFLSSVNPATDSIAYKAIHRLLQLLDPDSYKPSPCTVNIPQIEHRESTGHVVCSHVTVQKALNFIRLKCAHELQPKNIASATGHSLRSLEGLFKKHLKSTVQLEITKQRSERVKERLRNTDLSIEQISDQLDYEITQLRRNFQQLYGMPPSQYRNQFRGKPQNSSIQLSKTKPSLSLCFFNSLRGQSALEILRGAEAHLHNIPDVHLSIHIDRLIEGGIKQDTTISKPFDSYDGLILTTESQLPKGFSNHKPIICIDHQRDYPRSCSLAINNTMLGTLAAEHFLLKGYTHFAYASYGKPYLADIDVATEDNRTDGRFSGFRDTLLTSGISPTCIHTQPLTTKSEMKQWLIKLPKPIALLTFNDTLAIELLGFCKDADIEVPGEIALLGIDNDPFLSNRTHPALSSIENRFQSLGAQAVDQLIEMIRTPHGSDSKQIVIAPRIVIERDSTRGLATNNTTVNQAVDYIHDHYTLPIRIEEIAAHCNVSRRTLEGLFKTQLRQSPRNYLEAIRLNAAKDLLTQSDEAIEVIAHDTGFKESRYFCQVFKKHTALTPLHYRRSRGV